MSFSNPGYSQALQAAIDYAWSHGVVVVAATGNDGSSIATFPAGDRGVVGVSSTDFNDALDAFEQLWTGHVPGRPGRRDRDHGDGRGLRDDQRNVGGGGRGGRRRGAAAGLVDSTPRTASSSAASRGTLTLPGPRTRPATAG